MQNGHQLAPLTTQKEKMNLRLMCDFVSCRDLSEVEAEQKMLEEVPFSISFPPF